MVSTRKGSIGLLQALICSLLLTTTQTAWSLDLESVLESATVTPPARVGFREERHNKMLKDSLVLTGYLEYLAEGRLRKVVESPFKEAFLIDSDHIEIERDGETNTLPINKSGALKTMLSGIEAILAGQAERLEKLFRYELSGSDNDWSMQLKPRSRRIAKQLHGLIVTGNAISVTSIRFDLKGGEWHLMEILKTNLEPQS